MVIPLLFRCVIQYKNFNLRINNVNLINSCRSWVLTVMVEGFPVEFKLDSGADLSIIPHTLLQMLMISKPLLKK